MPAEMVTEPGEFTLAIQGRDSAGIVTANTPLLEPAVEVIENGIRDGAAPGMPTPDLYAQFVTQLEENNQVIQEASRQSRIRRARAGRDHRDHRATRARKGRREIKVRKGNRESKGRRDTRR